MVLQELRNELKKEHTEEEKAGVWSDAAGVVESYYNELVSQWKEEMDTLLVYVSRKPRHVLC